MTRFAWAFLLAASTLPKTAGADDGTVKVAVEPADHYIIVARSLSDELPKPSATAKVKAAATAPVVANAMLEKTAMHWKLEGVRIADGTDRTGALHGPGKLEPHLYNSSDADPVIASPDAETTAIRLGLKETGHIEVFVQATATWTFKPADGKPAFDMTKTSDLAVIDFYGLQAEFVAAPRQLTKSEAGYPVAFRILGPGDRELICSCEGAPITGARIKQVTVFLQPDPKGPVVEYRASLEKDRQSEKLMSGNAAENTPGIVDKWHETPNGATNSYTLFIPAEKLQALAGRPLSPPALSADAARFHHDGAALWMEIGLVVTRLGSSEEEYKDAVSGEPLKTAEGKK